MNVKAQHKNHRRNVIYMVYKSNMENRRIQQGIAEVTEQAYARRHGVDEEPQSRWWHIRTRILVMTIICVIISSLILYWFVSSILENHRDAYNQSLERRRSSKYSYLERLPNNVLPLEYTLKVLPILEEDKFLTMGDVEIQFYCKTSVKHVRLHAHGLEIQEVTVKEFYSVNESKIINKYVETEQDFIDIFLMQLLTPGETYLLRIKYVLKMKEEPRGFFRSKYINEEKNGTSWIAVSNFSPDYARWAFPCFDEPWIKACFRISIGRRSEMQSHSNSMRKFTQEIHEMPGYVWDHYERTLPMPTYLVAIMVTDFASYKINVTDRPFHTIFARKEVLKDTEYIGYLIPEIVRVLQNLTQFYYEPDKLDVIVVPDLAYAAMENWGLITLREDHGAMKSDVNNVEYKKIFAIVAAHEVAHQWFGNLVTPKWWSDVWLKEGFSSFFGNLALNTMNPNWTFESTFLIEFRDTLEISGTENAHALHISLNSVKKLNDVFDETTYGKSNCVVYMMLHFLGKKTFLSSVHRYIKMYHYRSADQENVWNVFQEESDLKKSLPTELTMKDIMRTWTDQAGFPILQIKRNQVTGAVLLTQRRFYNDGINGTDQELWFIPVTWTTEMDQRFNNTWMIERHMTVNDSTLSQAVLNKKWILFNVNLTGLYRVNYDVESWNLLIKSYKTLSQITKVQLLSDAFAFAKAGLIDYAIVWRMVEHLETEVDEILWSTAIDRLYNIGSRVGESNSLKNFNCPRTEDVLTGTSEIWECQKNFNSSKTENVLTGTSEIWECQKNFNSPKIEDLLTGTSEIWECQKFLMCKLASKVFSMKASTLLYIEPEYWTRVEVQLLKWTCSMGHKECFTVIENLMQKLTLNDSFNSVPEEYRMSIYCTYVKVASEEQWLSLLERYENSKTSDKDCLAYALGCHSNATILKRFLMPENKMEVNLFSILKSLAGNPNGWNIILDVFPEYWTHITNTKLSEPRDLMGFLIAILQDVSMYMDRIENVKWLIDLKGVNEDYNGTIDKVIKKVESNIAWNKKYKNETLRILRDIVRNHNETQDCTMINDKNMY